VEPNHEKKSAGSFPTFEEGPSHQSQSQQLFLQKNQSLLPELTQFLSLKDIMPGLGQLTLDPVWTNLLSVYKNGKETLDLRTLFQKDPQRFKKFRWGPVPV
jgi:hypothetical protein